MKLELVMVTIRKFSKGKANQAQGNTLLLKKCG
jgi:hypothetical protein